MCNNINNPKFFCRHFAKNVNDKDKAVQCDLCEDWLYVKCNNLENIFFSKDYDIDEMHNFGIPNKNKSMSLFHINACSLNKNFDDLQCLLRIAQKIILT